MKFTRVIIVLMLIIGGAVWAAKKLFSRFTFADLMVLLFIVISFYILSIMGLTVLKGVKNGQ